MTPKTQSVCKHCRRPKYEHDGIALFCRTKSVYQFEPVAEPASTGEPECGQFTDRASDGSEYHCKKPRGHDGGCNPLLLHGIVSTARPSEPSAPQTSAEDEALPREAAPILAALFNSLIEQNCPDSVSGYTIFDAMWPKIQAFAAPQPVSGDAPKVEEIAANVEEYVFAEYKRMQLPNYPSSWSHARMQEIIQAILRSSTARKSPDSHLGAVRD